MLQQEVFSHLPRRRSMLAIVTADCEQELVLLGGQSRPAGLLVAPVQELAQRGAEPEQVLVLAIVEPRPGHRRTLPHWAAARQAPRASCVQLGARV